MALNCRFYFENVTKLGNLCELPYPLHKKTLNVGQNTICVLVKLEVSSPYVSVLSDSFSSAFLALETSVKIQLQMASLNYQNSFL